MQGSLYWVDWGIVRWCGKYMYFVFRIPTAAWSPLGLGGIRTCPVGFSTLRSSSLDIDCFCLKHVTLLVEFQGGPWLCIRIAGHFLFEQ